MKIDAPITLSPGKLAMQYTYRAVQHQASANFLSSQSLSDIIAITAEAEALGLVMQACLNSLHSIDGFKVLDDAGHTLYAASLAANLVGTHGSDPGMRDYYSPTVKILGHGQASPITLGSGRCSFLMFTGDSYAMNPGEKYLPGPDLALLALIAHLDDSAVLWADFYGQAAKWTGKVAAQFNAHEQKRSGN